VLCCLAPPGSFAAKKPAKAPPVPKIPPGKAELFALEPRGIQRGVPATIKLIGTNLVGLTELVLHNSKIQGKLLDQPAATTNEAWIEITTPTNLARGPYELSVKNTNSESSKLKLYVDDLPQIYDSPEVSSPSPPLEERAGERRVNRSTPPSLHHSTTPSLRPPFSFWGTLTTPGKADGIEFQSRAGDMLIFDLAAKSIGSKANALLTLYDQQGALLASNSGLDGGDPLLTFRIPKAGQYKIQVADKTDSSSKEHFYRLSVGSFQVVDGCFPLGVSANNESDVELIGFNLPSNNLVHIKAGAAGEMDVPVDPEKFRSRRALKVIVNAGPELVEVEPNDAPAYAMKLPVPCTVNGRIYSQRDSESKGETSSTRDTHLSSKVLLTKEEHATRSPNPSSLSSDTDLFQFQAHLGQTLVVETDAARRGSPIDTKIEILYPDGKPVERILLQAVRDSHITFKNIDSNTDDLRVENWQEMELNQFMYLEGEVCKIFRMPQGPDSGFQFYNSGGKRLDYFDSSPIAHALDEPAYIVEPHSPAAKLLPNGLPVFTVYYANDDDANRKFGSDSHLLFNPPKDGTYVVRVTDSRGFSGKRFAYRLTIREAKPDFKVTLNGANPSVNAGSGKEFSVSADRLDGFDGDITVEITNVPVGFSASTPIVIQAGHLEAKATINADADAIQPSETNLPPITVTASAWLPKPSLSSSGGADRGEEAVSNRVHLITKEVNSLGKIKLLEKPKLFVAFEPYDESATNFVERSVTNKPLEITLASGQTIPAWLKVKRNGHDDLVTFTVDSLPHGVIVDNIGLNGVLIPKGQDARQIFLAAAKWVPDTDRLCFAKAAQGDTQTSLPVLLHVRRAALNALK